MSQTRLVTVAAYPQAHRAHFARALLQDAGIVCFVANEYGSLFHGDSAVLVRVPEDAAEEARTILQEIGEVPG